MPFYRWEFAGNVEDELALGNWLASGKNIASFSFGVGIIALFKDGSWSYTKATKPLDNKLRGRQKTLPPPTYVSTSGERYYIHFADGRREWQCTRPFSKAIYMNRSGVSKVAFAPNNGWYILFCDGFSKWKMLPEKLNDLLEEAQNLSIRVEKITISPNADWFVSFSDNTWQISSQSLCRSALNSIMKEHGSKIENVWLGQNGAFCIVYDYDGKLSTLPPNDIYYSSTEIPAHFVDNYSIRKTVIDINKGKVDYGEIPPIRVVKDGDKWISLDNRRLYVFRNAVTSPILAIIMNTPFKQVKAYSDVKIAACECQDCGSGSAFAKIQINPNIPSLQLS